MQQGNFTSLGDAFPQLINLTAGTKGRNPYLGGQNFTHCCLIAVNQSVGVVNGYVVANTPSFINTTIENLLAATAGGQFPCTAAWNGNVSGAPVVQVPDSWLEEHCPGWELSSSMLQAEWITPIVGFLLPAVVFCLSIPRRRVLTVYKDLFSLDLSQPRDWIYVPFDMILAWLSTALDTIIWLATCFAFAGPMLMSGLYEAYLDNLLLRFIREQVKARHLTLDMTARLLYVLLCGNLDLDPDLNSNDIQLELPNDEGDSNLWPNYRQFPLSGPFNTDSAWMHIEYTIHPLRTYRDMAYLTPRQWPLHDVNCKNPDCGSLKCLELPLPRTRDMVRLIRQTKTQLRTMLACQLPFGATVGAPVIFYLGTFIYSIIATLVNLGDNDTSNEIAFGMWYMILPHIAIVSGLLLAGNNPTTLEGVLAHDIGIIEDIFPGSEHWNVLDKYFKLAYESRYRPQWLWFRGRSKRQWIERVWTDYQYRDGREPFVPDHDMAALKQKTTMGLKGWAIVLSLTLLLLETPFVLAFLTAFYTPQVGVNCRSLTFATQAATQLCLIGLWIWAWGGAPANCSKGFTFMKKGQWLEKSGFYTPTANHVAWRSPQTRFTMRSFWAILWFGAATALGLSSVFISIGGTLMQLIGVYRSDLCDLTISWWTRPHGNVQVVISPNSALDIKNAKRYWLSTGITATAFLGVVCFCGWWYQHRLRGLFMDIVKDLGKPENEKAEITAAPILIRSSTA